MNSWKGKRVLVTGSAGFIGSHLTAELVQREATVRAFVHYNALGRCGWLDSLPKELLETIEVFPGDIQDALRVREAVMNCEVVFHLASLIAIPYSYYAPDSYVRTNILGTLNILNAVREMGTQRLVHTSTSEVYGSAQYTPIDENHPLQGQSPYSASKIGADMIAESYYRSFNVPVSIIRPFNTYGPRQSTRAVIPTIISQLYGSSKTIKLGALSPTRDFNYVTDTVAGFIAIAESDRTVGFVTNIGSGKEISIDDLVALLINVTGKKADVLCEKERIRPKNSEVDRLVCDNARVLATTDWQPGVSLEDGLEKTARWVRDHPDLFNHSDYTI